MEHAHAAFAAPWRATSTERSQMKLQLLSLTALVCIASPVEAQQPSTDMIAPYLRRAFAAVAKDLSAAVALMPAHELGFRPAGVANDVRTFGEIVVHLVLVNRFVCAMGDGKPDSTWTPTDIDAIATDKNRLVNIVNDTNQHCAAYLETLSDATLPQMVTTGTSQRTMQSARGNAVVFAIAHANEHYGNLVTYLRAKGVVPPAAAAQAAPFSMVTPPKP